MPGIAEGEPPPGHPQVAPPLSLPPAWQGPSALPEAMAIKGPEMEKMGGGAGLLLEPEWDLPVCPRRSGLPGSGNGMEESSPSSLERLQEAGAHRAPLHLPLLP